ncbi:tyrosine-type recombinase/integrase [Bacillus sp. Marseille-Q3570]|uniref:tyrosine-type recombinase/integrase n=1 Tax=Bacillus sp. Marseille-Q3570 TaxID=2963522 RepID=UPI0021B7B431|nr:tyrosine-type recombinase/integrase [Bacillus sp. Marseille-Q3570]
MEYVEPIKDIEKINKIKLLLRKQSKRDYLLFVLGINTGLRISELLKIKVRDIWDGDQAKEFYVLTNSPNIQTNAFFLNSKVKKALKDYLSESNISGEDFLFRSKKNNQPITRQQAYRIINKAAKEVGVPGKIGTHTLRKTFAYHAYKKGIAISILQKILNHSTSSETLKYIGIVKLEEEPIRVDVNL